MSVNSENDLDSVIKYADKRERCLKTSSELLRSSDNSSGYSSSDPLRNSQPQQRFPNNRSQNNARFDNNGIERGFQPQQNGNTGQGNQSYNSKQQRNNNNNNQASNNKCYKCNVFGHFARDCSARPQQQQPQQKQPIINQPVHVQEPTESNRNKFPIIIIMWLH